MDSVFCFVWKYGHETLNVFVNSEGFVLGKNGRVQKYFKKKDLLVGGLEYKTFTNNKDKIVNTTQLKRIKHTLKMLQH